MLSIYVKRFSQMRIGDRFVLTFRGKDRGMIYNSKTRAEPTLRPEGVVFVFDIWIGCFFRRRGEVNLQ